VLGVGNQRMPASTTISHTLDQGAAAGKSWWRNPSWWGMFLLIWLGRMGWWAYWGLLLEADSVGYLELQAALYHPPGYTVFATALAGIFQWVDAIVVAQGCLYGAAAAFFIYRQFQPGRLAWVLAGVLALEPCSGQLGAAVMAETLFLSLLLLAFAMLPAVWQPKGGRWWSMALLTGMFLGGAHLTRYAAPVFLLAAILHLAGRGLPWRRLLWTVLLLIAGFQVVLLPLRSYYKVQFGTWTLNAFSGASLWNLSAYLYPGSSVQAHPQGPFEAHLLSFADSNFIMKTTRYTNHIFQVYRPFPRYVAAQGGGTAATIAASQLVGRTAIRLIAAHPGRHLRELVTPNLVRPLTQQDSIYADALPAMIGRPLSTYRRMRWEYAPEGWQAGFLLLLLATGLQLWLRKRRPALAGLLLLSVWLYYIAIALLSVVFLRFLYVLPPLILLALGLQLQTLFGTAANRKALPDPLPGS
jgi:hypothetical protein